MQEDWIAITHKKIMQTVADYFLPDKVIYNGDTTVAIYKDGDKILSRPSKDDQFDPEVGLAMCIVKRVYGSRQAFLKAVASAKVQKP